MSEYIHISFQAYSVDGKKQPFSRASSLEVNTWSLCHFPPASYDIGHYSVLVCTEPGRLGVLLPCSGVSHSDRSKLAVTEARLGICCYASENIPFFTGSLLAAKSMQQVIITARNKEAHYNLSQMAFFI